MLQTPGYKLVTPIKSTGSSQLHRAVRMEDGAPGILKMPRAEHPGPLERTRYQREFNLLRHLEGTPGVPRALALLELPERPVLVLEDIPGHALSERLGQPFSPADFLQLALPLATTLAEVHRRGVIHKDIKPSNIVLSTGGQPWLVDFGIATLQRTEHVDAAASLSAEGTPAYMSPEQSGRMNRALDYRSDFYSLGVTLYEVLTGVLPFTGQDALQWFHAHLAQAPTPPHQRLPSVPSVLSAVVLKLLAKEAQERYQSAEGLKADLEKCAHALQHGAAESFSLGQQDFPARFQLPQRLYGREQQVATLLASFERVARERKPAWVLVRGYPGMGKSSVAHELHRPVLQRRGFFLSGKFDQLQRDVPYATLSQAFRSLVQQLLASTEEELRSWRTQLLESFEGNGQVLLELIPQLELLAGQLPPAPELPPHQVQHRFNRLFQRFLGVFATPERPLVLFLDDLQWSDTASLQLLQFLSTHPDTPPLLVIGAYRDNEVSPSHPLALTLTEVRKAGTHLEDIHLGPLSLEQTQQLVADALPGAEAQLLQQLSALLQQKTAGNPFFLLQLLQTLHQDGLLVRTQHGWRWDMEGAKAKGYSDNVVEFLVARLQQLPPATQHLLTLAACVGNSFSLHTLAPLSHQQEQEVERTLLPALQEDLLSQPSAAAYRFLHDRIQQAAYTLTPESERKALHLKLGRLLFQSLSPEELHERLFDVLGHFNASLELMTDPQERERLARLNAEAGLRTRSAAAHRSATAFFTTAFSLLPETRWESHHELAFKIRLDHAGSALMCGQAAEARQLAEDLLPRARTSTEMASAYRLMSDLYLLANEAQAAIDLLLECLGKLGIALPPTPTQEDLDAVNQEIQDLLGKRSIESLVDLPLMTDPRIQAAMDVLAALSFPTAVSNNNNLYALHASRMVALSIRHGNTDASTHGYVTYGFWHCGILFKPWEGYAFGKLACELAERPGFSAHRNWTLQFFAYITGWSQPFPVGRELLLKTFRLALEHGNIQVAGLCASGISNFSLVAGRSLAEIYQESLAQIDFSNNAGFHITSQLIISVQRFVQQLRGLTPSFHSMNGDGFDEARFEAELANSPLVAVYFFYLLIKSQSRFMCGLHEEALQACTLSPRLHEMIKLSVSGHPLIIFYQFYRPLVLAACHKEAGPARQQEYLQAIEQHRQLLALWADNCPENFRPLERLVSAELARLSGTMEQASHAYEEAVQSARSGHFIHLVALASELAARYWKDQGLTPVALSYARQAREAYRQWGAEGKVRQLDEQWPHFSSSSDGRGTTTTYDTGSSQLDALAVVKAQQAISSEILLDSLVSTLMRVALESAGAQRGALLLLQGDSLQVAALSDASGPQDDSSPRLPWSLLAYVRRTGEHVLLDDTSQPHPFSSDTSLSPTHARSVLCLPLRRKDAFYGLLYLENSLTTGAFSPGRLALLGHIASQAAISIENARLFSDVQRAEVALRQANEELELRVEQRTRELKQAQAQLVETARLVGMADIASNILHDVGNTLNSLVVDSQLLRTAVSHSRLGRVKQVSALLEQHQDNLPHFLTQHPQGSTLVKYVSGLANELLEEQSNLRKRLEDLDDNISRVRAIVQYQQSHASSTLLLEECDLSEVLEDALRLQHSALQHSGIRV
ncbi:AAA family ATPase, partial [Archangium sp.]|uniref:AAA family ATPase n=1 Tax=Archangium sp. TaxID=1872627 RepID=UPI002D436D00